MWAKLSLDPRMLPRVVSPKARKPEIPMTRYTIRQRRRDDFETWRYTLKEGRLNVKRTNGCKGVAGRQG